MKKTYIAFALLLLVVEFASGQNKINTHQIGRTMGNAVGRQGAVLTLDSLNNRANWVQSPLSLETAVVSGSYSSNSGTGAIIVTTLTSDAILMLPLCNLLLHGRVVWIEKQGSDLFAARLNVPSGNVWRYGSDKALYTQGTAAKCTCSFASGTGTWNFSTN